MMFFDVEVAWITYITDNRVFGTPCESSKLNQAPNFQGCSEYITIYVGSINIIDMGCLVFTRRTLVKPASGTAASARFYEIQPQSFPRQIIVGYIRQTAESWE
jgi:hypothetical protein